MEAYEVLVFWQGLCLEPLHLFHKLLQLVLLVLLMDLLPNCRLVLSPDFHLESDSEPLFRPRCPEFLQCPQCLRVLQLFRQCHVFLCLHRRLLIKPSLRHRPVDAPVAMSGIDVVVESRQTLLADLENVD